MPGWSTLEVLSVAGQALCPLNQSVEAPSEVLPPPGGPVFSVQLVDWSYPVPLL